MRSLSPQIIIEGFFISDYTMNIVSWNIQAGLGLDGKVDLHRIANIIYTLPFKATGGPDVICLQEVSRHFAALTNGVACDQVEQLRALFPDYHCIFRPAVDLGPLNGGSNEERRQFGCVILSRFPVTQVFNHLLTQKGASGKRMQRHLLEVVVESSKGPVRVATTHLEYYSQSCRLAQIEQMLSLHAEAYEPIDLSAVVKTNSPYGALPRPASAIFCGDFNFVPGSEEYQCMTADRTGFKDAWFLLNGENQEFHTCGFADTVQWPEGPHCRDFFFLTEDLAPLVTQTGVDTETRASDHQPIYLTIS